MCWKATSAKPEITCKQTSEKHIPPINTIQGYGLTPIGLTFSVKVSIHNWLRKNLSAPCSYSFRIAHFCTCILEDVSWLFVSECLGFSFFFFYFPCLRAIEQHAFYIGVEVLDFVLCTMPVFIIEAKQCAGV